MTDKPKLFPIPGFEGKYSVTICGKVYSHSRLIPVFNSYRRLLGKWLKPDKRTATYTIYCLYDTLSEGKLLSLDHIMEITFGKKANNE